MKTCNFRGAYNQELISSWYNLSLTTKSTYYKKGVSQKVNSFSSTLPFLDLVYVGLSQYKRNFTEERFKVNSPCDESKTKKYFGRSLRRKRGFIIQKRKCCRLMIKNTFVLWFKFVPKFVSKGQLTIGSASETNRRHAIAWIDDYTFRLQIYASRGLSVLISRNERL